MKALIGFIGQHLVVAFLVVVVLIVGLVLVVLGLLNCFAPDVGGQALGVLTAAITAVLAFLGVLVTQAINVYTAWSGQSRERENKRDDELQKYLNEGLPSEPEPK